MSEDWSDMSDDNENETTVPSGPAAEAEPRDYYLKRSAMLPVEGVVYCLTHTSVHDDTTDPYDYGHADCNAKDHRPIYYRARKGDVDERADEPDAEPQKRKVIAATATAGLTPAESGLVVRMTRTLNESLTDVHETLDRLLGRDAADQARAGDPLLALTESILDKLGSTKDSDEPPR